MEHIEDYRGHTINAWTEETSDGSWSWIFTIDTETLVRANAPHESDDAALEAAIREARKQLDSWPQ